MPRRPSALAAVDAGLRPSQAGPPCNQIICPQPPISAAWQSGVATVPTPVGGFEMTWYETLAAGCPTSTVSLRRIGSIFVPSLLGASHHLFLSSWLLKRIATLWRRPRDSELQITSHLASAAGNSQCHRRCSDYSSACDTRAHTGLGGSPRLSAVG